MRFVSKLNELVGVTKIKDVEGAEIWTVSWSPTDSTMSGYLVWKSRAYKAFLLKEDAEAFAKSLEEAHKLLQNDSNINITIEKQK